MTCVIKHDAVSKEMVGKYIKIYDDIEIYYEESGNGTPLIFIPGWTMTTRFFSHQITYFSKKYRTIVYDPRGQGRSTKTLEGNNYGAPRLKPWYSAKADRTHGVDLKRFIEAMGLKKVILAGWSMGAMDIYSYIKQFGTQNILAIIFIDRSPKALKISDGDWGIGDAFKYKTFADGINSSRYHSTEEFLKSTVTRKLTDEEIRWMLDESLKTPLYTAMLLLTDGWFADYSDVVPTLQIPVMNIVREDFAPQAKKYLKITLPKSEFLALGKHLMFWEFPDKFNKAVDRFLEGIR